jgi:hypothetical protein
MGLFFILPCQGLGFDLKNLKDWHRFEAWAIPSIWGYHQTTPHLDRSTLQPTAYSALTYNSKVCIRKASRIALTQGGFSKVRAKKVTVHLQVSG